MYGVKEMCRVLGVSRSRYYAQLNSGGSKRQREDRRLLVSIKASFDGSIRSGRVIEVLSRLISERGVPLSLRSDNGPEFVSKALLKWAARESLNLALIEPGKPWQNGLNESFNGKFRDECLSMEWFRCRSEARVVIDEWRRHYNSIRPHSSLNNMTPEHFCRQYGKNLNRGETLKNWVVRSFPAGHIDGQGL
ncbi:Integrase catalytic region [Desulfomicrobium baculatum DSM 4028]|uniref:Integrase catalytic region n=1 Tax=Desulfomicrobium baculatum (strain DSM 4028 / VKM B-1378 / X) TaxID=525897 RepID=C7LN82_DESBD|nr:Integrase catalytic region [Desulfomicrobium baculatum DSM 4028]